MARGKSTPVEGKKRSYKFHPGTQALREIIRLQKSIKPCIPRAPFERLVREIAVEVSLSGTKMCFKPDAICGLHTIAEAYVVGIARRAAAISALANRKTLKVDALQMVVKQQVTDLEGEARA